MLKRLSRIIKSVVPINYEQAGIYAGDEGYDINVNKHTDLKGALITSTQKAEADGKNHFSTGSITHSDIENHSNYSGSSFGVSGSVSANFETPFGENGAAQSTKQATDKDGNLLYTDKNGNTTVNSKGVDGQENTKKLAEGKESLQFSYGMGYGKDSDSQSSTTKSGINTQNIIIKDEAEQLKRTGKTVQEEIAAIKTDITTESAQSQSGKLENRFNKDDVQKELDFQREVTEKFGPNVAEAGSLLANKFGEEAKAKRHEAAIALEEAEKAKAENNNETNRALVKQARDNFETASREAKEWETGGSQRLVIDSALNVISTALAGRPAAEVVASGLSPAVNNQIKKATTDAKGNVNTALNLTAHALWGAVEAYAGNRNVAAGAAGAAGGEAAAHFLSSTLYDKSPEKLSEEEKRTVSSLSQVAAGIAGGSLSDSSDGAIIAAKTAKDAVENNYLKPSDLVEAERKYKACKGNSDCEMRVVEETNELSKKRNQELDEYRQSLERELLAAKRSAEQQCAGNTDCYLAYSQEANKHFKEQLNAYLAHVSEGKDFESLARNYYPDDAYFRSIWYGLTNSGPQKTKESLKSAKDYIDNTSFSEALDDVHSTDLYAAAKIGLANLASNSSQSENNQSTTNAVISDGNFNIASIQGKQNIETIKKSTEQDANKLEKADHAKMQKEVEQDVATIQSFAKNVGGVTDEAYRTMFIAEHRMFTHKVDEKGNPIKDPEILKKINEEADAKGVSRKDYLQEQLDKGRNIYQLHELSDQERNQLQKVTYTDPKTGKTESKYVVAFNGIFNDRNSAAKFAVQNYIAGRDDKTGNINQKVYKDVYFVHHPEAKNGLSELLVAGYEKMFETSFGNLLGMDNSSLQAMNIMKQYGKDDLYLGSHSRGTLTVSNALKALNTEDNREKKLLSNTTVKMVGPAADVTRADGYLSQLQTGKERTTSDGSIRIENHASDPVGSMPILLGGNPATTSENNLNKGLVERISDIFGDNSSVHNCHGLGQRQCITDGYRTEGDLKMGNEETIFNLNKSKGE